jgi:hypothetical protein
LERDFWIIVADGLELCIWASLEKFVVIHAWLSHMKDATKNDGL